MVPERTRHRQLTVMPLSREIIERRAIQAGVKASKKRHHLVSEQELLSLRVQTMSVWLRVALVIVGGLFIAACWFGWPWASETARVTEAIGGVFAILFGAFGIRRTLSGILDSFDAADLVGTVVEAIGEEISNMDF